MCVCETFAALSIFLQDVSARAGAEVASLRVLTDEVARLGRLNALIHVWKERGRGGGTEGERCSLIPLPEVPGGEADETDRHTGRQAGRLGWNVSSERVCGMSTHAV